MDKFEVEFYTKDNGEKPAKDLEGERNRSRCNGKTGK